MLFSGVVRYTGALSWLPFILQAPQEVILFQEDREAQVLCLIHHQTKEIFPITFLGFIQVFRLSILSMYLTLVLT